MDRYIFVKNLKVVHEKNVAFGVYAVFACAVVCPGRKIEVSRKSVVPMASPVSLWGILGKTIRLWALFGCVPMKDLFIPTPFVTF